MNSSRPPQSTPMRPAPEPASCHLPVVAALSLRSSPTPTSPSWCQRLMWAEDATRSALTQEDRLNLHINKQIIN